MRKSLRKAVVEGALFAISLSVLLSLSTKSARAQTVEPPTKKFLFLSDQLERKKLKRKKKEIQNKQREVFKKARESGFPYDINATTVKYDVQGKKIRGEGGVIIGYASSIIEAEEGEIGIEDKVANLKGDVRITDASGTIAADSMSFKLDDGTGLLKNAQLYFDDGHYQFAGEEISKVGKDDYEIKECSLTTCECAESDSTDPWRLEGKRGEITRNGYGTIHDGTLYAYNVPVFYSPYLLFPVKTQRTSGLIPGTFGGGRRSGYSFSLPLFLAIDESTDATITTIYNANARIGVDAEYRQIFSDYTLLEMGGVYFNESIRGTNDLLGARVTDLRVKWNPDITAQTLEDVAGDNRFAGFMNFDSSNHKLLGEDLQFIVRGKYVNDDLLLREYNKPEIGEYTSRFVTSRAAARYNFLDTFSLEAAAEYNQAIIDDDRIIFQRLPDINLGGLHVLRPFGENDLGAKLVVTDQVTATDFIRERFFDGAKEELYEKAAVPFHVKNYFDVEVSADARLSKYQLNNTQELKPNNVIVDLPDSSDRAVPGFGGKISSIVEKVFDVGDSNPLKYLTDLGNRGRAGEVKRIKHTVEPSLRYRFVPEVDQAENPQFDANDRLPRRNLVNYTLMQRFFGRFEGRDPNIYGIEETTPEAADLGVLSNRTPIDQAFDAGETGVSDDYQLRSRGQRAELFNFSLSQTYDIDIARKEKELEKVQQQDLDPFSDVTLRSNLIPNEYLRFTGGFTMDPDSRDLSSYDLGTQLLDKRGDQVRALWSFTDGSLGPVRTVQTSIEIRLTDRFKLGFFGRYDDVKADFLERKIGFRMNSACRCWILDVDIWDRLNPDETQLQFTLTLNGIAELGSNLFTQKNSSLTGASSP